MTPDRLKPQKVRTEKLFVDGEAARARYREVVRRLNSIGDPNNWPAVVSAMLAEDDPPGSNDNQEAAEFKARVNEDNHYLLILCPAQLQGEGFLTLYIEHPPKEITTGKNPRAPFQRARLGFITMRQWEKHWEGKRVAVKETPPENINDWFEKYDIITVLDPERDISKNPELFQRFVEAVSELEAKAKELSLRERL